MTQSNHAIASTLLADEFELYKAGEWISGRVVIRRLHGNPDNVDIKVSKDGNLSISARTRTAPFQGLELAAGNWRKVDTRKPAE